MLPFPSLGRFGRLCLPTTWSDRGVRSLLIAKMKSPTNSASTYIVYFWGHAKIPPFLTQSFTAFGRSGCWPHSPATPRHFEKSPRPALALHWRWRILQNSHENWCTVYYNSYIVVGTISTQRQNLRIMCYAYLGKFLCPPCPFSIQVQTLCRDKHCGLFDCCA